jgi:hypothetical protein
MRRLGNRQGMAAIVIATGRNSVKLSAVRAMIVHRLAHAAGMLCGGRDGQGHGDKNAHEHQGQQQPGGEAVHLIWSRIPLRLTQVYSISE